MFVCFSLLFCVHSLFLLLSGEAFPPFFYFICAVSRIRHIRSGCLAYFSFFVVSIIFDLHYIHPTICVFLSNNLWSFCCLPGTCYFFSLVFFLYFILLCFLPPRNSFIYVSCRLGWNGLICLICAHLEERALHFAPPPALSADDISYLSTVLDLD